MESASERGKRFEREVAAIFRTLGAEVQHDVGVAGNQIDILVRERTTSGSTISTIVECKSFSRPVGIKEVNSFGAVSYLIRQRGLAEKAIMVSESGFTRQARESAREYKIDLLEIDDLRQKIVGREHEVIKAQDKIIADNKIYEPSLPKRIFVVMPFSKEFDDVYILGIREVAEELGLIVERADDVEHTGDILDMVREHIRDADFIVADTTGTNPNVMYEVGYSHGVQRPTILICRTQQDLPFDVSGTIHIKYDTIVDLRERLKRRLKEVIEG